MPSIFVIESDKLTIKDSDGNPETLGNPVQGTGEQLLNGNINIRLDASFKEIKINESPDAEGNRTDFLEDNTPDVELDQRLDGDTTINGTTYTDGTLIENEYRITLQDANGEDYSAYAIEVDDGGTKNWDNVVALTFEGGKVPPFGKDLNVIENTNLQTQPANNNVEYEYSNGLPCFTAGALIETPEGPRPIEALEAGDLVLTRDNGPRPVRWIARRHLDANALRAAPHLRPILFEAGSLAPGVPARRTRLSPQHRVLMTGPQAELHFEDSEVFAKAKHLTGRGGVGRDDHSRSVTYVHLLLDRHEVLMADGMWSESFRPGETIRRDGDADMMAELDELFPDILHAIDRSKLARPELRRWEAALLTA